LFQFGVLALARLLGRPSYYLNAMVSDCPVTGRSESTSGIAREALKMCAVVTTRDPISYAVLGEIAPGIDRHLVPDALFSWAPRFVNPADLLPRRADAAISFPEDPALFGRFDFERPYLAVSGGSLASWDQTRAVDTYLALVASLQRLDLPIVLVQTCRGDRFLEQVGAATNTPVLPVRTPILQGGAVLAGARAFISARYHPSILASLGGTPLVLMQGNSFKNEGLRQWIGHGEETVYPAHPDEKQISAIVQATGSAIDAGDDLRRSIRARACDLGQRTSALQDLLGAAA
jgi:polysaccharide pyruvyl transferase WcaK-like protein